MKIAIDARIVSYVHSGIARYASCLLEALSNLELKTEGPGTELTVIRSWRRPQLPLPPSLRQALVLTPPHSRFEPYLLPIELALRDFDVVHAMDFFCPVPRGSRLILSIYDLYFLSHPESMTPASYAHYRKLEAYIPRADTIICSSRHTAADVIERFRVDPQRCVCIYPGIDLSLWQTAENAKSENHILFVGTLEQRKNIPRLLQAYARVRSSLGEATPKLKLVGRAGNALGEILALIDELELASMVELHHQVDDHELRRLYRGAICLAFVSSFEGFGFPLLEAMASRCPVLTSYGSSLEEVSAEAAYLVDHSSVSEIAHGLEELIRNEALRSRLIAAGLRRVQAFSWEQCAQKVASVYSESTLESRRASHG